MSQGFKLFMLFLMVFLNWLATCYIHFLFMNDTQP